MFVTQMLVGSALYWSIRTLKHQQERKGVAEFLQGPEKARGPGVSDLPGYAVVSDVVDKIKSHTTPLFSGDLRRRQLQVMTSTQGEKPVSEAEQQINRNLVVSVGSLTTVTIGATLAPTLSLVGAAGLIYVSLPFARCVQGHL